MSRRWITWMLLGIAGVAFADEPSGWGAGEEAPEPEPASEPLSVPDLNTWARSAANTRLGEPRLTESQMLALDGVELHLGAGTLRPILYGGAPPNPKLTSIVTPDDPALQAEETTVGFVWTGEGEVGLDLSHGQTGTWLANWQHRTLGVDPSTLGRLAEGGLFSRAHEVVAYGGFEQLTGFIDALDLAPNEREWLAHERLFDLRGPGRSDAARIALRRDKLGLEGEQIGAALHVLTDQRYGLVVQDRSASGEKAEQDSWLVWRYNPESRSRYQVTTKGRPPGADVREYTLLRVPWEAEAGQAPLPPGAVEPLDADLTLFAQPSRDGLYVEVRGEATLTLRADEELRTMAVAMPWANARPDSARVTRAALRDGRSILFASDTRGRVSTSFVDLVFPEPIPAGQTFMVELDWEGTWDLEVPGVPHPGTGLQDLLPTPLPSPIGAPWRYTARVGVPEEAGLTVALSGPTKRRWTDDGGISWLEVRQEEPGLWPSVSMGEWSSLDVEGTEALPALSVRLFPNMEDSLAGFAGEISRILKAYHQLLPAYPFAELEVAQAQSSSFGFTWIAPDGLINVQQGIVYGTHTMRAYHPHLEEGVLAHELAHGWFGHQAVPATEEDFWIAESFSEAMSCIYLAAAFGAEDCAARLEDAARTFRDRDAPASASLTRAYSLPGQSDIVYAYGPYVLHHMLRGRLEDEAYLAGLKAVAGEGGARSVTTDEVQRAFEQASGQDLQAFFDFWVRGGFIPERLIVATRMEPREQGWFIVGELASDVPFGRFDLQLQVRDAEANYHNLWVDVVDGAGAFELGPFPGKARPTLRVDPAGLTLARGIKLKRLR